MNQTTAPGPDLAKGIAVAELTDGKPLLGHVGKDAVLLTRLGRDRKSTRLNSSH